MFSEPTIPKSHINLPFTIGNLLTIYMFISDTKVMPELLHAFFLSGFSVPKFHIEYESLIREEVIKSIMMMSETKMRTDIIMMMRSIKKLEIYIYTLSFLKLKL